MDGFRAMLADVDVRSVLEVGCNRGHNLLALQHSGYQVAGVEPMAYAREIAARALLVVADGSLYDIPAADASSDLVFTCGVLEHVPPERLDEALAEVVRVSRRYVLAVEYHAEVDTEIAYRGREGMLWKRDYAAHYQRHGCRVLAASRLGPAFDSARFVLLEKVEQRQVRVGLGRERRRVVAVVPAAEDPESARCSVGRIGQW